MISIRTNSRLHDAKIRCYKTHYEIKIWRFFLFKGCQSQIITHWPWQRKTLFCCQCKPLLGPCSHGAHCTNRFWKKMYHSKISHHQWHENYVGEYDGEGLIFTCYPYMMQQCMHHMSLEIGKRCHVSPPPSETKNQQVWSETVRFIEIRKHANL